LIKASAFISVLHAHEEARTEVPYPLWVQLSHPGKIKRGTAKQVALYHISTKNWLKSSPSQVFFFKSKENKENINFFGKVARFWLWTCTLSASRNQAIAQNDVTDSTYMISPIFDNAWFFHDWHFGRIMQHILARENICSETK